MDKKKELRFIINKELSSARVEVNKLSLGVMKIDSLNDSDLNEILSSSRRDSVKRRFMNKVKFF